MTKLVWHQEGDKRYEFGVDRGVFYQPTEPGIYSFGVVWNGLTEVQETSDGGDAASYYYDGVKYLDIVAYRQYKALLSAYSAPNAFFQSLGEKPLVPGFILTRQERTLFGLSYRTFIGPSLGYKIHLVYNILASPNVEGYSTMNEAASATIFSWKIDAVPPRGVRYYPTAHYILDSRKMIPDALGLMEDILYGTDASVPRLPTLEELRDIVALWNPLYIVPHIDTGLAELESGMGDLYTTSIAGLNRALSKTRLGPSPVDGLYRLEA